MRVEVFVTLKSGVLDPQGLAVGKTLTGLGFSGVEGVRVGKYIELELASKDPAEAKEQAVAMCERLIANTVIEDYRIVVEG